jgi:hypothetical protein
MDRAELVKALKGVMVGVNKKADAMASDFVIFDGPCIRSFKDNISVSYNLDTGITCGVHGEELFKILEKLTAKEVSLELKEEKLIIKCGKVRVKMNALQEDAFNNVLEKIFTLDTTELTWYEIPTDFIEALKMCASSAAKEASQNWLNSILFTENYAIASDNQVASVFTMDKLVPEEFMLPIPAAESFSRVEYPFTIICVSPSWVHLSGEDESIFSARLLGGKYESKDGIFKLLEREDGTKFTLPKDLKSVLDRVEIFAGSDNDTLTMNHILISYAKKEMIVKASKEVGEIVETLPWEKDHIPEGMLLRISPDLLKKILGLSLDCRVGPKNQSVVFKSDKFSHVVVALVE